MLSISIREYSVKIKLSNRVLESEGDPAGSVERPSRERGKSPGAAEPLLLGKSHSGSPSSGMYSQFAGAAYLEPALSILGKSSDDLFLANKITAKCSKCGDIIPRFEGYRHINIGEKKTYCFNCQKQMGLPTRSDASSELAKMRGSELATGHPRATPPEAPDVASGGGDDGERRGGPSLSIINKCLERRDLGGAKNG